MNYTKKSYPIQQAVTGEMREIHAYTFEGNQPGSHVYLQGNLHGPEIMGTPLLGKLINYLEDREDIPGKVTIVPCVNPIGVQTTGYNSMEGRWHPHTGKNWNRIFPMKMNGQTKTEERTYFESLRTSVTASVEQKLAATIKCLQLDADVVLDIHTTGVSNLNHIFLASYLKDDPIYNALGVKVKILWDMDEYAGSCDEAAIIPYYKNLPKEQWPKTGTWEVHHHANCDAVVLEERFAQLCDWLAAVWGEKEASENTSKIVSVADSGQLYSPVAGYYTWKKEVGDIIHEGDIYAEVYQPWNNQRLAVKADFSFIIIGLYGIGAIADGEQIAVIGKVG